MAPYLSTAMARSQRWPGESPLLLKPEVYHRELSPAGLGISRYIGATYCVSGQQSVCSEGTGAS